MVIVKDGNKTALSEKNNNLMKVIESEAARKSFDAMIDIVSRNGNTQPYVDAGKTPAVVLAYTKGVIAAIFKANSMLDKDGQLYLSKTIDYLLKAKEEARVILNNI
jgi:hypothetical protein